VPAVRVEVAYRDQFDLFGDTLMLLADSLFRRGALRAWSSCFGSRRALLVTIVLIVLAALLAWHTWRIALGGNFHTVVPGAIYRCARPEAEELRRLAMRHQLQTVVNLEGECPETWVEQEHALGIKLGVGVRDVGIWARQPPSPQELCLLVDTLATAHAPVLIHCRSGCDRSGLASALALLLRTPATPDEARRQLSVYYGHNPFGRATCLDRVLDDYEAWLRERRLVHQAGHLLQWAHHDYVPQ